MLRGPLEYLAITRANSFVAQVETSVSITCGDVDACEIKHDVGMKLVDESRQIVLQGRQISIVVDAVG